MAKFPQHINSSALQPCKGTVLELFFWQVMNVPEKVAVKCGEKEITYRELDKLSGILAAKILDKQVIRKDDRIAILSDYSSHMVVALFAVLKCGAAYVPVDAAYPPRRMAYMLEDSGAVMALTQGHFKEAIRNITAVPCCILDEENDSFPGHPVNTAISHEQLAYVVYTSGSTDQPKGVMIDHKSLYDYVLTFLAFTKLNASDITLLQTSFAFDTSVEVIFTTLCAGATLVIAPENKNLSLLETVIEKEKITILNTTPLVLNYLNHSLKHTAHLRLIISGGDVLKPGYIDKLYQKVQLINTYGPTESTIVSTFYNITVLGNSIPIGKPVNGRDIYLFNEERQPVALGEIGEIYIGGTGLARGYLNKPALTDEAFVAHPFNQHKKVYRTGDLGKWLPDGNLEFIGRIDQQIKIRGYRVELMEVEGFIASCSGVKDVAVVDREYETGEKYLHAFIIPESDFSLKELKTLLPVELPEYMIPSHFSLLSELPQTENGKTDRKALRQIIRQQKTKGACIPEGGSTQETVHRCWLRVLEKEQIGVTEHFMESGGNSMRVIELLNNLEQQFPNTLTVADLFDHVTIQQQTNLIESRISTPTHSEVLEMREVEL